MVNVRILKGVCRGKGESRCHLLTRVGKFMIDKLDHVLTIWDIRYGTLQAERIISAVTVGDEVDGAWVAGCTYSVSYSLLILPTPQ